VGGPGTAKTAIINQFLAQFPPDTSSAKAITFSYFTAPGIFQRAIEVRACRQDSHLCTKPSSPVCRS